MTIKPISTYPVPELDQLPHDIRQAILYVQEKAGFIPNVFITLAHRPDEFVDVEQLNACLRMMERLKGKLSS